MRKLGVLLLLVMSFVAAPAYPADLLELEGMVGVPSPAFAIAGIPGGGFPWVINRGDTVLDDEGLLKVKVRGLLIDPAVGPPLGGTNPVAMFIATLICDGAVVATIGPAPADVEGNSDIRGTIDLPTSCFIATVLVRSGGGTQPWFAVTGFGP